MTDDTPGRSAGILLCLMFVASTASPQSGQAGPPQIFSTVRQSSLGGQLSADEAVQEALVRNLGFRAQVERIPVAEGQLRQAGLLPNPVLTSTLVSDRVFGNEGEGAWSASFGQEVETAGKRRYRLLTAQSDLDQVRYETGSVERDLTARTSKAYFSVVTAERNLDLARQTSATLQQFVNLNAERVKVGEAPGVELNLAKIELARSQLNEQNFERAYRETTATLNLLMGRPPGGVIAPSSDFSAPVVSLPPDQELLDYALQHRPEVLAANSNVEARLNATRLARALGLPNVTWRAAYQQQSSVVGVNGAALSIGSLPTTVLRHNLLVFEAELPLPLFNRNRGNVASAEYERRSAEETAQYVRNTVVNEVATALSNYRSRLKIRSLYEESVLPQLQRNLDAIQEAYRLGNENVFAVIQVQRTFFDTRREYLQTLLELELDRIDLERAAGRTLR